MSSAGGRPPHRWSRPLAASTRPGRGGGSAARAHRRAGRCCLAPRRSSRGRCGGTRAGERRRGALACGTGGRSLPFGGSGRARARRPALRPDRGLVRSPRPARAARSRAHSGCGRDRSRCHRRLDPTVRSRPRLRTPLPRRTSPRMRRGPSRARCRRRQPVGEIQGELRVRLSARGCRRGRERQQEGAEERTGTHKYLPKQRFARMDARGTRRAAAISRKWHSSAIIVMCRRMGRSALARLQDSGTQSGGTAWWTRGASSDLPDRRFREMLKASARAAVRWHPPAPTLGRSSLRWYRRDPPAAPAEGFARGWTSDFGARCRQP